MDFKKVINLADRNQTFNNVDIKVKRYSTEVPKAKKEPKKTVDSSAIKAFLEKKKQDQLKKEREEYRKKQELIALRAVKHGTKRASIMASRTKDNNYAKAFGLTEDEVKEKNISREIYLAKMRESKTGILEKRAQRLIEERATGIKPSKEKKESKSSAPRYEKEVQREPEEKQKVQKPKPKPKPPPPMDFNNLLQIASKKQFEPIVFKKKEVKPEERPLTKAEKERLMEGKTSSKSQPSGSSSKSSSSRDKSDNNARVSSKSNSDNFKIPSKNNIPQHKSSTSVTSVTKSGSSSSKSGSNNSTSMKSGSNSIRMNSESKSSSSMKHGSNSSMKSASNSSMKSASNSSMKSGSNNSSMKYGSNSSSMQSGSSSRSDSGFKQVKVKSEPHNSRNIEEVRKSRIEESSRKVDRLFGNSSSAKEQTVRNYFDTSKVKRERLSPERVPEKKRPLPVSNIKKERLSPERGMKRPLSRDSLPVSKIKKERLSPERGMKRPLSREPLPPAKKSVPSRNRSPSPVRMKRPSSMPERMATKKRPSIAEYERRLLDERRSRPMSGEEIRRRQQKIAMMRRKIDSDEEEDDDMADFICDDDDNGDDFDYSEQIKEIMGYDKSRYVFSDDEDIDNMETSYFKQQEEEKYSLKYGKLEDEIEKLREEQREQRELEKLKKERDKLLKMKKMAAKQRF